MTHADTVIDPALEDGAPVSVERGATVSAPAPRKRFGLRIVFVAVLTALLAGAIGQFALFAHTIATAKVPSSANADAIVVLTGGHARVSEAVRLLEEGRANRLLISGVHPGTTREQLAAVTASAMPLEKASVDLDRVALNTAGNAAETAAWVKKNGFGSLLVVTSAYHLPRAEAELSGALPDVDLIAYPVFSKDLKLESWYQEPATMRLLMREYVKYILARLRITVKGAR
ncbi:YdcF family protein [Roseibium sp. Sym1]|uniref:YdcF family protein n=1 Tax=Roseibium sp. Sym1 TaxID=3016006 RepID=UPI0022B5246F|nr:YdcF family protein [Roseibium sp. Sym1]